MKKAFIKPECEKLVIDWMENIATSEGEETNGSFNAFWITRQYQSGCQSYIVTTNIEATYDAVMSADWNLFKNCMSASPRDAARALGLDIY